ncbi:MAG: radical SAM protein [Chitinophagales bacterium]
MENYYIDKFLRHIVAKSGFIKKSLYTHRLRSVDAGYERALDPSISLDQARKYNLSRADGPQHLLCNAPFTSLFINMNGDVNVCGYNKTFILGNVLKDRLSDLWMSEKHQSLQRSVTGYNLSNGCQVCQQKIDMEDYHRAAIYFDTPRAEKSRKLRKITFELSNLCNLECVMCNGELSSLIRKNREKKTPVRTNDFSLLLEELDDFIPDLRFTQYLGGEPLLIKPYYRIWDKIIRQNRNCKISVQTNAAVLPDNFMRLLQSSADGQFIISVSIDSFQKDAYERIRLNARFEDVMENIYRLADLKRKNKIHLSLNFVPMTINWREIIDAIIFANENQLVLSMCEVDSPFQYTFYSMSEPELLDIIAFLEKNMPIAPQTMVGRANHQLCLDMVKQLRNIAALVRDADKVYSQKNKTGDLVSAMEEFQHSAATLPVRSKDIDEVIAKMWALAQKDAAPEISKKRLNIINRYFYLRKVFFSHKTDHTHSTETFENLLYYELRSAYDVISESILGLGDVS